jgi:hypothetical protein
MSKQKLHIGTIEGNQERLWKQKPHRPKIPIGRFAKDSYPPSPHERKSTHFDFDWNRFGKAQLQLAFLISIMENMLTSYINQLDLNLVLIFIEKWIIPNFMGKINKSETVH